jgi:hypothetical protein
MVSLLQNIQLTPELLKEATAKYHAHDFKITPAAQNWASEIIDNNQGCWL